MLARSYFGRSFFIQTNLAGDDPRASQMSYASNALCGSAFHEAGRAVVARYFGLTVVEIEIRDDASGRTDTIGSIDDLPLIDRIAVHCAGQASSNCFQVPQSDSCFR